MTDFDKSSELIVAVDIKLAMQMDGLWEKFASLAPSHRKEYLQWIEGTKKPETRARRIQKMCEMIATSQKDRR